jgi:hypothetical protein
VKRELVQQPATGWMTEGLEFGSLKSQERSLLHVIHAGCGANEYHAWAVPLRIKRLEGEADQSPLTSAGSRKRGCTHPLPKRFHGEVIN